MQDASKKLGEKKKQSFVTKKILRIKPNKYHYLIPPNTSDATRVEIEQRQRPVSTANSLMNKAQD